ncbi:MAG: hypothetical protein AB3N06_05885 [Erythrobacter sp.]
MLAAPLLALSLLAQSGCSGSVEPADPNARAFEILDRHVAAVGGEVAFANRENMRTLVEITEQGALMRGDYRAARDGRMRIDVYYDGKRFFSEGIDAQGAWQQAGEGAPVEKVTGEPAARLRRGIDARFETLADSARKGQSVRYVGPRDRESETMDAVEIVGIDGHRRTYFFERDTGLATRMQEREALHPDADPTETDEEEIRTNFRSDCGILQPGETRVFDMQTGEELQSTRLVSTRCNLPEYDLDLGRPAA